jgi:hypothetical protein
MHRRARRSAQPLGAVADASAIQALKEALTRPSNTPCTWRGDRDAYLAEQKAALLARVIEPVTVQAVANEWAQKHVANTSGDVQTLVAVARHDDKWLLFDPKDGTFALAWVARCLTPHWSRRVKDKVPSTYSRGRAAQLNR